MLFLDVESAIQSKMSKEGSMWYCNDCSYQSNKKSHLYDHVEARHISHPGYQCQYCDKVFKTKDTYMETSPSKSSPTSIIKT